LDRKVMNGFFQATLNALYSLSFIQDCDSSLLPLMIIHNFEYPVSSEYISTLSHIPYNQSFTSLGRSFHQKVKSLWGRKALK
jgi:hypothetical protein